MEKFNSIIEKNIQVETVDELKNILTKHNIPFEKWNTEEYQSVKTVNHLFNEINDKDCEFVERNGELIRRLRVLGLRVFYTNNTENIRYMLVEEKQVFLNTGKIRERKKWSSVAEKIKTDEHIDDSLIKRALQEELQIGEGYESKVVDVVQNNETSNQSFPGVKSEYPIYRYEVELNDSSYKKEGYTEEQNGLTTHFVWKKENEVEEFN